MSEFKKFYVGIDLQNENQIVNLPAPTNDGDAVNKSYVDTALAGVTGQLHYEGVLNASTYTTELDNQTAGDYWVISVAGTIEGVEFDVGDILLLNSDTVEATSSNFDKIDNSDLSETEVKALFSAGTSLEYSDGVFSVANSGIGTTQLANDSVDKTKINADVAGLGLGQNVDGSLEVNVDGSSVEINVDTIQLKDDGVTASKINADVAGDGLVQNVTTGALDVNVDDSTLETSADAIQVKDGGITEAKLATAVADKLTDKYAETVGDGTETTFVITHNLGTEDVMIQIYEVSTGKCVECQVTRDSINQITVGAFPAPASNDLRILVRA